jgi:hypothetical protein
MNFEEYLGSKKIDSTAFAKAEPTLWQEWKDLFEQISPASFTTQKLYLLNPLRRRFQLKEIASIEKKSELPGSQIAKPLSKPVIKPKIN